MLAYVMRRCCSSVLALVSTAAIGTPRLLRAGSPQTSPGAQPAGSQRPDRDQVRTVVDWSLGELRHNVPELKGMEPAVNAEEGSERLSVILKNVGENVKAFFESFTNTTSVERIRTVEFRDGKVRRDFDEEFNYLMLAAPEKGQVGLKEFRTQLYGRASEPVKPGGVFMTEGFASASIHFHPLYQAESVFRYLGRQRMRGKATEVVAFAQRPTRARLTGKISVGPNSTQTLVQGVAWIDRTSYQIRRLRTDMLAPHPELGLDRETTNIQYGAVYFRGVPQGHWLPKEVAVILTWRNTTLFNDHTYSHFRLFSVESKHPPSPSY